MFSFEAGIARARYSSGRFTVEPLHRSAERGLEEIARKHAARR